MSYFKNDEAIEPSPLDIEQLQKMNIKPYNNGKNPVLYALRGFVRKNPDCKIPYTELEISLIDYFAENHEIPSKSVFGKQMKRAMKILKKEGIYTKITSPRVNGIQQKQFWISKNPFPETTKGGAGPWLKHKKKRGKYTIKVVRPPETFDEMMHSMNNQNSIENIIKTILESNVSNDVKFRLLCALIDS